jgi:hypothetical protein
VALRNDSYQLHVCLPTKVDPLVSLMKVEKVPDSTYDMIGGLDQQIKEIKEVRAGLGWRMQRLQALPGWDCACGGCRGCQAGLVRGALGVPQVAVGAGQAPSAARSLAHGLARRRQPAPGHTRPYCLAIAQVIELPLKHPELFESLGIAQPKGVLLYGPPGTGKTLLARAVAHHTDCTFIRVSGSELVQKYIGEGSRMVRELFVMARCARRQVVAAAMALVDLGRGVWPSLASGRRLQPVASMQSAQRDPANMLPAVWGGGWGGRVGGRAHTGPTRPVPSRASCPGLCKGRPGACLPQRNPPARRLPSPPPWQGALPLHHLHGRGGLDRLGAHGELGGRRRQRGAAHHAGAAQPAGRLRGQQQDQGALARGQAQGRRSPSHPRPQTHTRAASPSQRTAH